MHPVLRGSSFFRKTLALVLSPLFSSRPVAWRDRIAPFAVRWIVLVFVLNGALATSVLGQDQGQDQGQDVLRLSDRAQASMLTILPGDQVYAEFGHSAIRIHDPQRRVDVLYNYGTFNFNDPMFVPKFTYGQLDYFLTTQQYAPMVRRYRQMERPVIEQHLNLTPEQVQRLFRFLQINARPENRMYRYDFLFDNCSTRVRDAMERSLGAAVAFSDQPDPQTSFRYLLDPYVADRPLTDLGFDLGLGHPADQIASAREAMFLPEYLFWAFENAFVQTARGAEPLVARTDTLFWVDGYNARQTSFPWPLVLTWLVLGAGAAASAKQIRSAVTGDAALFSARSSSGSESADISRRWDAILFGVAGLSGVIISFLWFISEHTVTDNNLNIVWALPTHLVLAVFLARGHSILRSVWTRRYLFVSGAASGVLALGWFFWPQGLHEAVLPVAFLVSVRSGVLWYEYEHTASSPETNLEEDGETQGPSTHPAPHSTFEEA